MITIALAESHNYTLKRSLDFFKYLEDYKVIIEASNGYDLIQKLNTNKQLPDLILVDINMPVIDGISVICYIKLTHPSIKLIGISNDCDQFSIQRILFNGADGFVQKSASENVLLKAIETVLQNELFLDPRLENNQVQISDLLVKRNERRLRINLFKLTKRERTFIILNATFLTYEQIAETMFVETKTVNSYYDKVSKKFDLHNRHSISLFSLQNGLAALALFQ